MTRAGMSLVVLAGLSACGGGSSAAEHEILSEGSGDVAVRRLGYDQGARWTYFDSSTWTHTEERVEGTVGWQGHVLDRHVSPANIRLLEAVPDGQLFWGSTLDGMVDPPLLLVSLPLREGREWTTRSTNRVMNFRCRVSAVETLETPAGRFLSARVEMTNLATMEVTSRWFADGVGLVQEKRGAGPPFATKTLFDYVQQEVAP